VTEAGVQPILARLQRLHPKVIDLSLGRVLHLLQRLGNPQQRLPPVIHVAGTNGKGSTIAFLRAILQAHSQSAHVYTSPHLVRFNERIVVAGREITDPALALLLQRCEEANAGAPITFFEITTAAAFLAFAETPADVTLLETGLGGRLDATNVCDRPAVTAITPISLDHQGYLGDTIPAIAAEKAGILKPGVPCVVATQPPEAAAVITARAGALGIPLALQSEAVAECNHNRFSRPGKAASLAHAGACRSEWQVAPAGTGFRFRDAALDWQLPLPTLPGLHQLTNAGTAIAVLRCLPRFSLDEATVARGLQAASWPARLQHLSSGRLARALPAGWELWLDGGHNPGAAAVLADQLSRWRDRPRYLVIGLLASKDAEGFVQPLARHCEAAVAVAIPGEAGSLSAEALAALTANAGLPITPAADMVRALAILATRPGPARVLVCGSLYLAGSVLAANGAA
jgi:dihydrofolate synthase/folylpolyglutamate synthase